MAYVVGSASVEIIPDFRQAQRRITEFFAKQQNDIRIPVNPEMSRSATEDIRRQAQNLGRDAEIKVPVTPDMPPAEAAKARAQAQKLQQDILRDAEQAARERTRIEQEEERARSQAKQAFLRDDAKAQKQIFEDAFKTPARARVKGDEEDTRREAGLIGSLFAAVFSESVAVNAEREIKARSAFLSSAAAGAIVAGAPLVIAGATALFAGVGLAATASSTDVKETWRGTWGFLQASSRQDAAPFVQVHHDVAAQIIEAYQGMRPVLRTAFADAAPATRDFAAAVLDATRNLLPGLVTAVERSQPVMAGVGNALRELGTGVGDFFFELSGHAPALGQTFQLLAQGIGEALPLLADLLGTGSELATVILPGVNLALGLTRDLVDALGPLLPTIAAGFATWRVVRSVTGWLGDVSLSLSGLATRVGGFADEGSRFSNAAGRVSSGAESMASAFNGAGNAGNALAIGLPALGLVVAGIANTHQDASTKEDQWTQAILAGGQAAADAYKNYTQNTHWGQSVDEATGLASSWDQAKEKAAQLREQMTPLQRAQSDAAAAQADLTFNTQKYGPSSDQAKDAANRNTEAQIALGVEQRKANEAMRDTMSAADAAAAALEDYNAALRAGDTFGAAQSMRTYKEETATAAEDQRKLNAAIADTVPSSDAAKAAQEDLATALRNNNVAGATEALNRYKTETFQAAQEQINLTNVMAVTSDSMGKVPTAASAATFALGQVADGTKVTQEQWEMATKAIEDWRNELQTVGTAFVDPLNTYQTLLEAKSASERKSAQATADMTVSTKDSWRDYVATTKVTLDDLSAKLEEQIKNQQNWRSNIVLIAQRGGFEVAQALASMGVQGADIVQQMVDANSEDFNRLKNNLITDAHLGGSGAAAELDTQMRVMAAIGNKGASDTVASIAAQLGIGVDVVSGIASKYGVQIAQGINPVLTGLGHAPINTSVQAGKVRFEAEGAVVAPGAESHVAQIARPGDWRVWAEPETGGEAYIPLAASKRARSLDIWRETGRRLGVDIFKFAQGSIVDMGRRLQKMGALVAEHPAFPPLDMHGHGATSLHYTGHAIDVNTRPGTSALEQSELAPMAALARSLGFRTIFMAPGHYNHLHIDDAGSGSIGSTGIAAAVVLPSPPSTAPYQIPISTPADASMAKMYDEATAWLKANTINPEGEGFGASAGPGGTGGLRDLGRQIATQMGWGNQFGAIDSIFTRESGWNPRAQNPTSTANGIPQFLIGNRAKYGASWSDPAVQIRAGIQYMVDRYGSPNGANAFWNAHHWYHNGGVVTGMPGADVPAVLRVGETVRTAQQETTLATSIDRFRKMVGLAPFSGMGTNGAGTFGSSGAGAAQPFNINGFVNNGTIQVMDMDELTRAAENSKVATLARLGI